jgi:hypothetical protein
MTPAAELWTLLRVLLSLVVVLSLAVVLLRFGLPWLQRLQGAGARRGPLELVQVVAVDRLHRLAVVRYAGRELVLGIGGGVRLLASGAATEGTAAGDGAQTPAAPASNPGVSS